MSARELAERPRTVGAPWLRHGLPVVALVLLAAAAYHGVAGLGFLRYDDDLFVTHNPWVRQGLTRASLRWALTADLVYDSPYADYWAPMTVTSRLLDASLFGMSAKGHHLTNLALHALNVALVFLVFRRLTGRAGPGAFAAAVLAVHPLHVESVAWVTERKDVLSLLFWMLALLAYARWVRGPTAGRWALVVLAFTAGLLSKPSVITLPVVLLLLDRWPLARAESWARLLREKWLLFALSAASAAITIAANLHGGLVEGAALPLRARAVNAIDAYVAYLSDAAWPARLAVGHAHRGGASLAHVIACLAALAAVTALCVRERHRRPYLLVGWTWFAVTALPTIGLLQSGLQGRADRFMYIPLLGLSLAVGTLVSDWSAASRARTAIAVAAAAVVLAAAAWVTHRQVRFWQDDLSLFRRAAAVEPQSPIAANGLGAALAAAGDLDGAERELARALSLKPDFPGALKNLAALRTARGRGDEAASLVERALAGWAGPGSWARPEMLFELARVRSRQGRSGEALELYAQVLRLDPRHWAALYNTGNLLAAAGRLDEAGTSYARSLLSNPDNPDALRNLGLVFQMQGRTAEAIACFRQGLVIDPGHAALRQELAAISNKQ
jgi:tetratricopeptide (TPR) repeat protein